MLRGNDIYCVEGEWSLQPGDQTSIVPLLNFMRDVELADYQHRDVVNASALRMLVQRWGLRKYRRFPILYIPCHGEPRRLLLGHFGRRDAQVSLDDLESWLKGRCRGRVVFLGVCDLFRDGPARWRRFLRTTGALAVCGYAKEVRWTESAAFELIVLSALQRDQITRTGLVAIKRRILTEAGPMARRLGFRMFIRPARTSARKRPRG